MTSVSPGATGVAGLARSPLRSTCPPVAPGDTLVITKDRYTYEIDVLATPKRRGPAPEARACYAETEDSVAAREALSASIKAARMSQPLTQGRPDKHTRRQLRDWKDRRE